MLHRRQLPDHRDLYFAPVIGPLMIRYSHPSSKLEAVCHRCRWAWFEWTEFECKTALQEHLWKAHDPHQDPASKDRLPPPGL
jgi:hypothetical protein